MTFTQSIIQPLAPDAPSSEDAAQGANGEEQALGQDSCVLNALKDLSQAVGALQRCFDTKLRVDKHKDELFDNMHRELTDLRNGVNEQVLNAVLLEIIQVIDSIKRDQKLYASREYSEENYKKLLRHYGSLSGDLEDILYRYSVEPYEVAGEQADLRRQKVVGTVPTDAESENNLVAQRVACGYEKNGKVIRAERVTIKKFTPPKNIQDENKEE